MSDLLSLEKNATLALADTANESLICKISHALSVPERVQILRCLLNSSKSIAELEQELHIPSSSIARHVNVLADAQLIFVHYQPGLKGHVKYCSQAILGYTISMNAQAPEEKKVLHSLELPIGLFSHCHIETPCGMVEKNDRLAPFDCPNNFFIPERVNAECLWFDKGFISYNFPTPQLETAPSEITFSFEICSETAYYNNNWPSDITIYINKKEVTTFTSPGDFGGRRGKYTPEYWPITSTQFGILKKVTVNATGVYENTQLVNKDVKLEDLNLMGGSAIQLTIGIKEDAVHKGGINLFGKNFGDYPQAIIMTIKQKKLYLCKTCFYL